MSSPYETGGAGGKFRKRPFRRPPVTPYDRPPSAARVGARGTADVVDGESLRSRLVGTASRLITEGASRIFASFFHRRLAAPPAPPEESHQFRQEVPEATDINPSPERHEEGCSGDKQTKGSDVNISDTAGISEVEQLLKQKTFTRAEFDRLTKLLLSRTVESGALEPVIDIQNEDTPVLENRVEAPVLHEKLSTDATNVTVAKDDLASPAELAKAYMGSIPSKVSPSSLILRSEVFHEDTTGPTNVPFVSNPLKRSAVPRSVIQISGTPGFPENTYQTPKPHGRSNSPLSSSPYFKARPTSSVKGVGLAVVDYTGPSSSRLPPTNLTRLGGRQALKRRSSVLDTDSDSFGPIRRIRQKYYSTPPSRIRHSVLSNKVSYKGSSLKMPSSEELKHYNTSLLETENKENEIGSTSVPPVPPKSTETAMKILQQLDILVSPSKEKSSEPKSVAKDKSPSNLTHNVLGGWSPKNMEDSCNFGSNSSLQNFQSKKDRVEENDPLQAAFSGGMLTSESCSTQNIAVPPTDVNPVTKTVTFAISASAKFPPRQNTSFRMSAHKDASGSLSTKYEPETTKLKHSGAKSETVSPEKFLTSSSSIPGSSSLSLKDAGKKGAGNLGFCEKDTGFSVSVTSGLSMQSQQPPTPIMSVPSPDILALQKEQAVAPAFAFGSKAAPTSTPITASAGNTASQKVDARDATTTTAVEDTSSGKISEMSKPLNVSGNSVLSGISMKNSSGIFSFASSSATTTTQSNGSLYPASLSSPPSAGPAITHSDTRASSPLFTTNSTSPTISMSSPSIPYSAPIFSTVTSFKFGSSMSTDSTASVNTGTTASLASSSASPSTGSIFKFSASSQPTSSFTDAVNKSQSAATAAGSTQSTQLGLSSSQFGLFSSSSALGLSKPSSGFGTSPFVFGPSATETSTVCSNPDTTSSVVPAAATSLFNPSSQPFTSSVFGFTAGSSSPSPSTGSLFGNSSSATGSSSSPFSSTAIPVFSFVSAIPTTSPAAPVFGTGSPGNDKMNVENTTNAVNQTAAPTAAIFGQPSNLPTTPTFVFGSGTGGPQNPAATPGQPFQAGNLGFAPGGGFSVGTGGGTGGGDKGGRRFVKIRRDKKPPRK